MVEPVKSGAAVPLTSGWRHDSRGGGRRGGGGRGGTPGQRFPFNLVQLLPRTSTHRPDACFAACFAAGRSRNAVPKTRNKSRSWRCFCRALQHRRGQQVRRNRQLRKFPGCVRREEGSIRPFRPLPISPLPLFGKNEMRTPADTGARRANLKPSDSAACKVYRWSSTRWDPSSRLTSRSSRFSFAFSFVCFRVSFSSRAPTPFAPRCAATPIALSPSAKGYRGARTANRPPPPPPPAPEVDGKGEGGGGRRTVEHCYSTACFLDAGTRTTPSRALR